MEREPMPKQNRPEDALIEFSAYTEKMHAVPYVYKVEGKGKEVTFFGAKHTSDPNEGMFKQIEEAFREAEPDFVFIEGRPSLNSRKDEVIKSLLGQDKETVIRSGGEPNFTITLAAKAHIELESPEPNPTDEYNHLLEKGFSKEDVFAYYVYRAAAMGHFPNDFEFPKKLEVAIEIFRKSTRWKDFDYTVVNAEEIGKKIWGEETDLTSSPKRFNPIPSEVGDSKWSISNEISQASTRYRDMFMLSRLQEALKTHNKIFIVYGASHAYIQEPAIRAMLG